MKACVISGAANGIGKATLRLFLVKGYRCIGIDNDETAIARVYDDLDRSVRERARFVHADLLDDTHLDLPGLDDCAEPVELTVVNNLGGAAGPRTIDTGSWEDFRAGLEFNLKPLHTLTQRCLSIMRRHAYGRIVNVSSVTGRAAIPTVGPAYAAAKAAVLGLTRHLALELSDHGILVNTVCPGFISTERIVRRWETRDADTQRTLLARIPARRLGDPDEVAQAIYFLGSTATYSTGCVLDVNGGLHMP